MQVPVIQLFCGSLSPEPWHDGSIGVCWFEIHVFIPVLVLFIFLSLIYCAIVWKHLAFDNLYCSVLYFRVAVDVTIITNSCVTVVLSFLLPYYKEGFAINSRFVVIHNLLTAILWVTTLVFDFLHGKALKYSSRGPLLHLLFFIVYLFCCVINCWFFVAEIDELWKPFIITNCYIHVFLLCLHAFSKVPIFYPTEEPRRRTARIYRESLRIQQPAVLNGVENITQNVKCEDQASYPSRLFFCWVGDLVRSGYYGELYSLRNLPTLPKCLNTYLLESKLPKLEFQSENDSRKLQQLLERLDLEYSVKTSVPLLKIFSKKFGREFLFLGLLKLLLSCFSLCSPVVLNHFIVNITNSENSWSCILSGLGLILLSCKIALLGTSYNYRMAIFNFKVRVSVSGMVYRTILSLKSSSLSAIGTGSLVNYLTSDADRIINLAPSVHEVWAMPLQLCVAIALLYRQLGLACLVGIGFLIVLTPLNRLLASQIGKFSRRLMLFKDTRIKLMSEFLSNMLSVKLACWENLMKSRVMHSRVEEMKALRGQKLLDACCVFFWAVCPALLASSTFATYAAMGNELNASTVFPSLALFGMLIGPMNAFPWVINGVMEATVSIQRIMKLSYLSQGPFPVELTTTSLSDTGTPTDEYPIVCSFAEKSTISMPVSIVNESFYYTDPDKLVLKNISLQVQWGELICVTGPVGSGKSSLLLSILGELQAITPENELRNQNSRLRYAYVGQTPWLHAGTIRENILFGSNYDPTWLNTVIEACALVSDLANLPHGLDTDVGEAGGSRLSGGQRARVALARAVYQKADVYLLDDPLSALDVDVSQLVANNCLLGLLSGKTRIIVTHQLDWFMNTTDCGNAAVDFIVELKDGTINRRIPGTPNSLHNSNPLYQSTSQINTVSGHDDKSGLFSHNDDHNNNKNNENGIHTIDHESSVQIDDVDDDDVPLIDTKADITAGTSELNHNNLENGDNNNNDVTMEHIAMGSISPHVYKSYIRAVGYVLTLAVIVSLLLMQGTRNASDWWLSRWVQQNGNLSSSSLFKGMMTYSSNSFLPVHSINYKAFNLHSKHDSHLINYNHPSTLNDMQKNNMYHLNTTTLYYLKIYSIIVASNILATVFRAVSFAFGGLVAASVIHESALDTILEGRLNYFDSTPLGRIVNRFSSDVGTVDDALPFQLNILLASLAGLLGALFIVCVSLPTLIFFLLPLVFIFWSIQRQYRGAARDLKRISSVVRSPVYAHYTDTLSGLTVIRGLGQEIRFRQITASKLGDQIRAELTSLAAGSWLSIRLQLIGTGVIACVIGISLVGRLFNWTQVAAIGLSTTYALNIAGLMTSTVYDMTETEKNLVAVERCQELTDDTPIEFNTVSIKPTAPQPRSSSHNHLRLPKQRKSGITYPIGVPFNWPASGSIFFNNVSLTYRRHHQGQPAGEQSMKALEEINFTVKPGECVGIVGRTGSGKSSLIKVLLRLVDHLSGPYTNEYVASQTGFVGATGEVFVDGVDIRTVPLGLLRSRILSVCQEPFLFSGCLRDNLDPENQLDDATLEDALLTCQLAGDHLQASEWLTRNVGESGRGISAGQRQLICLARALLRQPRPKIICLDEATASIDNKCEEIIHQILEREFKGATILLIAHRLSSINRLCSRVIVMQTGRIIADGPPEETLSTVFKNIKATELITL